MRAAADTNLQLPMCTQCSDNFSFAVENIGDSFAAALRRRQNRLSFLQRQEFAAAKERTRDFDVTGHFRCCKFVLGFAAAKKERQFCRCNVDFVSALLPLFFFCVLLLFLQPKNVQLTWKLAPVLANLCLLLQMFTMQRQNLVAASFELWQRPPMIPACPAFVTATVAYITASPNSLSTRTPTENGRISVSFRGFDGTNRGRGERTAGK